MNPRRIPVQWLLCGLLLLLGFLPALRADDDFRVCYGLLHAHTMFSDGSGTPEEAYKMAKEAGLHFFAVTPHNHLQAESGAKERQDGVLIARDHALYNVDGIVTFRRQWRDADGEPRTEMVTTPSVLKAAKDATDENFVALYGQEFSTISSGNHVNVLDFDEVITSDNGNFRQLYELLEGKVAAGTRAPVLQLNHPNVQQDLFYKGQNQRTRKQMKNDYGVDDDDLGPHFVDLVKRSDPFVTLIEVLSGPAMKEERVAPFHYKAHENDYYFYLVQGFHIGPTAGQDNHYKTWGTATDARTGVLCKKLTKPEVLEALRESRTFATEDKNLEVVLRLNGSLMGNNVKLDAESELSIVVEIKDADEAMAQYDVELYYGDVQPTHRDEAVNWKASDGLQESRERTGNGQVTFSGYTASGRPEFFYVKVEQAGGDRAWSAPVWVNHPKPTASAGRLAAARTFVWSKESRSKVYHLPDCKWARMIGPRNRQTGSAPPVGWKPHKCQAEEAEPGH